MISLLLFLGTIMLPTMFWFWLFIWLDRAEPEPKKLLIKLFIFGCLTTVIAGSLEVVLFKFLLPSQTGIFANLTSNNPNYSWQAYAGLLLAAIMEETLKFRILKDTIYDRVEFNQIGDGIIYAVSLALGFAAMENLAYLILLSANHSALMLAGSMTLRGILTTILHFVAAGITGLGIGRKKYTPTHPASAIYKGLAAAIVLHGLFNAATTASFGIILLPIISFGGLWYLLRQLRRMETRVVWRLVSPK